MVTRLWSSRPSALISEPPSHTIPVMHSWHMSPVISSSTSQPSALPQGKKWYFGQVQSFFRVAPRRSVAVPAGQAMHEDWPNSAV